MKGVLIINLLRETKRTILRFLSIFSICALGVAFFCGLRAVGPDMREAADATYATVNLSDLTVMSSSGLTQSDIDALRALEGVEAVRPVMLADAMMRHEDTEESGQGADINVRLISMPIKEKNKYSPLIQLIPSYDIDPEADYDMNTLTVVSGRLPVADSEVVLDAALSEGGTYALGDYVVFSASGGDVRLRVVGLVNSPKYIGVYTRGMSTIGNGSSGGFAYASGNAIARLANKLPLLGLLNTTYAQADIVIAKGEKMSAFSDEYDIALSEVTGRIEAYGETQSGTWYITTRSSNPSYSDYGDNTERIDAVGDVFPVIFFVVAALVSLTTMTRMVEEQRVEMGTMKALGYGSGTIITKYMAYALIACVSGSFFGALIGFQVIPAILFGAYSIVFRMAEFTYPFRWEIASVAIIAAASCTGIATLSAAWSALREMPSSLMRPKAPKIGKRIVLERITFLWKKFSFSTKVMLRNLFRYKQRFFMSLIGIAGSSALLVSGFGIKGSIFGIIDEQFGKIWTMDVQAYTYEATTLDNIAKIASENEVYEAFDYLMYFYDSTCDVEKDGAHAGEVHLYGVKSDESLDGVAVLVRDGEELTLQSDGAIITKKLSEDLNVKAGDTIELITGGKTYDIYVSDIADNYVYHYVYMLEEYYESMFGQSMKYNGFMGNLTEEAKEAYALDEISETLLSDSRMYAILSFDGIRDTVNNSLSTLNYVTLVLIVGSALLTFVVMLNMTNINISERKRELATLRVLGFYDKEMYDYIFRENNALAVLGAALGLLLGKYMHLFIVKTCEVDMIMFVRSVSPMSYVYSFALTIVFSMVVNLVMRKKVRTIDMVESLKSAE